MPERQYRNCRIDPTKPRPPDVAEVMDNSPKVCYRCGKPGDLFDPGELVWWCVACACARPNPKRDGNTNP